MENLTGRIVALRRKLHALAENSGFEVQTRACLMAFLREYSSLEIHDEGPWFWAMHREEGAQETLALRADFDAVPTANGPAHLCGHDGHAAALCGLGCMLEGQRTGKNICLIFQHAEETGEGGRICAQLLRRLGANAVYALHNLPGYPFGQLQLYRGTFACASRGLILKLQGSSAHAAYPESGRNPMPALCGLIVALPELLDPAGYEGMVMATPVGIRCGERAFGMAASEGEVCLTLRAHRNADLERLEGRILGFCRERAAAEGLEFSFERADVFPATENHDACVAYLEETLSAGQACLSEPMRWSEDFGWYLMECPGAYFGIGAGEMHPALHTPEYEFPDALLPEMIRAFAEIAGIQMKEGLL